MQKLSIENLIISRSTALGLSLSQIISRTGLQNVDKAQRQMKQLFAGEFNKTKSIIDRLPDALELPKTEIDIAIEISKKEILYESEKNWRLTFKPHAVILTERNGRPKNIAMAAICNASRFVKFNFPVELKDNDFKSYTFSKLNENQKNIDLFFFPIQNVIVNLSPDSAIIYDVNGNELSLLNRAVSLANLSANLA